MWKYNDTKYTDTYKLIADLNNNTGKSYGRGVIEESGVAEELGISRIPIEEHPNTDLYWVGDYDINGVYAKRLLTSDELLQREVARNKEYLESTDFKFTSDYDDTGDVAETINLRAAARAFIRDNTA